MPKPRRITLPFNTASPIPHAPLHALDVVRENHVQARDTDLQALAVLGYTAFLDALAGVKRQGFASHDELPARIQTSWLAAAQAIRQRVLADLAAQEEEACATRSPPNS